MAKTYAPQFIRVLRKLAIYATKHSSQMNTVLSPAQQTAVQQVVTAAQAFSGVVTQETP